jgi:hypothetical protein
MIVIEIVVLLLLGATTWLAQDRSVTRHAKLNGRLTAAGLILSVAATAAIVAAVVIRP